MGCLDDRVIGEIQQPENHDQDHRHHQQQALPGPLLILVAAAPSDVITSGQPHRGRDFRLGVLDEAADVAVLHVEQHRREQKPVLRRDHRRPAGRFN